MSRLRIALSIISACGLAVSIGAIVSYVLPSAGYCGGLVFILSLTALALCTVSSRRHNTLGIDSLTGPLVNIQNDGQIEQSTLANQNVDVLLDEICTNIFNRLNGKDLTSASGVCKQWNRLAQHDRLWMELCLQEMIVSPEGLLKPASSYKDTFYNSQRRLQCILNNTPHPSLIPIQKGVPKFGSPRKICAFFKTNDKFFLCSDSFEIWDSSLRVPYLKECVCDFFQAKADIRIVGQTLYLFGRRRRPVDGLPMGFMIYSFNIATNKLQETIWFRRSEADIDKTAFEIDANNAFIGRQDGSIVVWDLKHRLRLAPLFPNIYEEDSTWSEADENTWNATYDKVRMEEIKKKWSYADCCTFETSNMDAGEFQRSLLRRQREYHHMLQNRVWLKGHTKAITSLRAVGPFLFSASQDATIKQWDLSTSKCIQTIETGFKEGVASFQVAGQYIFGLSNGWPRQIVQWDFVTGERLAQIDLKEQCHSFKIVGNLLFCLCRASKGQVVEIYNLSTQACIKTLTAQCSWHNHIQVVDKCLYLLVEDHILKWDFSHLPTQAE